MKLIIIGIILFCAFMYYAICAVPKSAEEQIKYLEEYKNKRSMVKY